MAEPLVRYESSQHGVARITLPAHPAHTASYDTRHELAAAVRERARAFAPPGRAGHAVGTIERAVQSGHEASLAEGLALERELPPRLFGSEDAAEGRAARLEKPEPSFQGR